MISRTFLVSSPSQLNNTISHEVPVLLDVSFEGLVDVSVNSLEKGSHAARDYSDSSVVVLLETASDRAVDVGRIGVKEDASFLHTH